MTAEHFRAHFPALRDTIHLCSCSEGAQSDRVITAMAEFMYSWREHGAPWGRWMEVVEECRVRFARLIHASPDEVAVVSCASEGAHQVASTLPLQGARRAIVTNDLEFPSVGHVWLAQAEARDGRVHHLPAPDGRVTLEDYRSAVDDSVALVSAPLASYANGLRLPLRQIADLTHAAGARLFVDAYQGAGVLPVDVHALDCDYLVAGALKYLLGAPGIAFLYVRGEILEEHRPLHTGWFGRANPYAFDPRVLDFSTTARRFETGTAAIPAAYAAAAGLSLIEELDMKAVERHVADLAERLQRLLLDQGARLYSPLEREARGPQVTVRTDVPEGLTAFLARRRILASPRGSAVRLSLHYYNTASDVEAAAAAIAEFARETPLERAPGVG
jgi:selenocysteine lyase/cysteine desulfurase